ncbi:MAG: aldolase/citrate lyase family protein [Alphaproteobacteria bacterium]
MKYGFRNRLEDGRPALGCLANMGSAVAAEILGRAGYDCVMTDMEHGPGDVLNTVHQLQAVEATPAVALVRVPENAPVYLKRVLDAGPNGVMIPAVQTPADAQNAVAACRYPPRGVRGVAHPIARASGYGTDLARYMADFERELLVICQIETMAGVENARAIAATEGVDMIFLGPMDLSASAGFFNEPDHPEVEALIGRVEAEVKGAGRMLGGLSTKARPASVLFERGYAFVLDAVDIGLLRDAARNSVEASLKYTAAR